MAGAYYCGPQVLSLSATSQLIIHNKYYVFPPFLLPNLASTSAEHSGTQKNYHHHDHHLHKTATILSRLEGVRRRRVPPGHQSQQFFKKTAWSWWKAPQTTLALSLQKRARGLELRMGKATGSPPWQCDKIFRMWTNIITLFSTVILRTTASRGGPRRSCTQVVLQQQFVVLLFGVQGLVEGTHQVVGGHRCGSILTVSWLPHSPCYYPLIMQGLRLLNFIIGWNLL